MPIQKLLVRHIAALTAFTAAFGAHAQSTPAIEEVTVWGAANSQRAAASHPSSILTQQDLVSINVTTTEEYRKY